MPMDQSGRKAWLPPAIPTKPPGGTLWPKEVRKQATITSLDSSLFAGSDKATAPMSDRGGVSLPALRLEKLRGGPVTSWRGAYHAQTQRGVKRAEDARPTDLWDSQKGWSTSIRDQDDYGPFGVRGSHGITGPPPPWEQRAADERRYERAMRKIAKLRPTAGSGDSPAARAAREERMLDYTSMAKGTWSWPEPPTRHRSSRRFDGHPAVQALVPMPSLHAMGAHHESLMYRVNCSAPRGC